MAMKIIQLSDCHLCKDPKQEVKQEKPTTNFLACINDIKQKNLNADMIILSGDLTDSGEKEAYQILIDGCKDLDTCVYAIAGNHDDPINFQECLANSIISTEKSVLKNGWHFIFLDSNIKNHCEGKLSAAECEFLTAVLQKHPNTPTIITLHHHALAVGGGMDTIMLTNNDTLFDILDEHPQVVAVLSGHVHQENAQMRNGVHYLTAPATCYQVLPQSPEFEKDTNTCPGYRCLKLHDDATIKTNIERI